jgi:hypothetical protein
MSQMIFAGMRLGIATAGQQITEGRGRPEPNPDSRVLVLHGEAPLTVIETVLTPAMFRNRSYDCQQLAERAPNARVRDTLLDMARTWTRLALEAEDWKREDSPRNRLAKKDTSNDRPTVISPAPLPLPFHRSSLKIFET